MYTYRIVLSKLIILAILFSPGTFNAFADEYIPEFPGEYAKSSSSFPNRWNSKNQNNETEDLLQKR